MSTKLFCQATEKNRTKFQSTYTEREKRRESKRKGEKRREKRERERERERERGREKEKERESNPWEDNCLTQFTLLEIYWWYILRKIYV